MSHIVDQAKTIELIASKLVKKDDLPSDYSNLVFKWLINDKSTLLSGEFADFWIIDKTISTSSKYSMFCGKNVPWINTAFNIPDKLPTLIILIENSEFKGILVGDVIIDLIKIGMYGIFLWISSPTSQPSHQTLLQFMSSPPAVTFVQPPLINVGGRLFQLPPGGKVEVINHLPNAFEPLSNISHFRVVRRG
jgi:hypothetical protein